MLKPVKTSGWRRFSAILIKTAGPAAVTLGARLGTNFIPIKPLKYAADAVIIVGSVYGFSALGNLAGGGFNHTIAFEEVEEPTEESKPENPQQKPQQRAA